MITSTSLVNTLVPTLRSLDGFLPTFPPLLPLGFGHTRLKFCIATGIHLS